jgi:hypothetical protein
MITSFSSSLITQFSAESKQAKSLISVANQKRGVFKNKIYPDSEFIYFEKIESPDSSESIDEALTQWVDLLHLWVVTSGASCFDDLFISFRISSDSQCSFEHRFSKISVPVRVFWDIYLSDDDEED